MSGKIIGPAAGTSLPIGGAENFVLTKKTATTNDLVWKAAPGASGGITKLEAEEIAVLAHKPAATDRILFVSRSGNDTNDGLAWGTAKLTIQAAITALGANAGTVYVGAGEWEETVTYGNEGQKVIGVGGNNAGTIIKTPADAAGAIVIKKERCGLENVRLVGHSATFTGKLFLLGDGHPGGGAGSEGIFRNITMFGTTGGGTAGTGLATCNTENVYFEQIQANNCKIGYLFEKKVESLTEGATQGTYVAMAGTGNAQDLVKEGGGGNTFIRFKTVSTPSVGVNVVELVNTSGNGGDNWIELDCNEGVGTNPLSVATERNLFISGAGSPESVMTVSGERNTFIGMFFQNVVKVTGVANSFIDCLANEWEISGNENYIQRSHSGVKLTISGNKNVLLDPQSSSQGVVVNGLLNVVSNAYGVTITGTDKRAEGFFGKTPVAREKVAAAASNLGTAETLANSLRTMAIKTGLMEE